MKTVKTPKGTVLPLTNLKGKDYLMVAYRLIWFTEEVENYSINTEYLHLDDNQTVAKVTVTLFNNEGRILKQASGTKRETKSDFSDHTEKAETSALGRALAMLGYGTQFAVADLEEGERLVDSPVTNTKASSSTQVSQASAPATSNEPERRKISSFRKTSNGNTEAPVVKPVSSESVEGWE